MMWTDKTPVDFDAVTSKKKPLRSENCGIAMFFGTIADWTWGDCNAARPYICMKLKSMRIMILSFQVYTYNTYTLKFTRLSFG